MSCSACGVWQGMEFVVSCSVACGRQRRRMLHPRSEPQIFATLDALCGVVRSSAPCCVSSLVFLTLLLNLALCWQATERLGEDLGSACTRYGPTARCRHVFVCLLGSVRGVLRAAGCSPFTERRWRSASTRTGSCTCGNCCAPTWPVRARGTGMSCSTRASCS